MHITSLILIPHYTIMFKEAENDLVIFFDLYTFKFYSNVEDVFLIIS